MATTRMISIAKLRPHYRSVLAPAAPLQMAAVSRRHCIAPARHLVDGRVPTDPAPLFVGYSRTTLRFFSRLTNMLCFWFARLLQSAQRPGSAARSREHPTHATMAAIYGAKASPGGGRGKRGGGKQTQSRRRRSRPRSALPRESAPTVHHSGRSTLMASREAPQYGGRPASATVRSREVTTTEEEARRGNLAHLRGIHGQIRAATGLFAGNVSGRGERPASSRSAKPGHGRRPVSATARGAAGTYKLDMSAPAIGPRRARPWSAIAPRTFVRWCCVCAWVCVCVWLWLCGYACGDTRKHTSRSSQRTRRSKPSPRSFNKRCCP